MLRILYFFVNQNMLVTNLLINFLFALVTILLLIRIFKYAKIVKNLPPGPWGFPGVGYMPWLGSKPCETFVKLGRKYGGIFSVNLGGETVVMLNDWTAIKACFVEQSKIFIGRSHTFNADFMTKRKDVIFADGPVWKEQRRLMIQCLKNVGAGKRIMENHFMDVVNDLTAKLRNSTNKIHYMHSFFFGPLLSANCKLISSHPISNNEDDLKELETTVIDILCSIEPDLVINNFPWLRFVTPTSVGYTKLVKTIEKFNKFLKKSIDHQVAQYREGFENTIVDFYMKEINSKQNEIADVPPYNVEHLFFSAFDIFLAGVDTSNNTLQWGFLYLSYYPEVQKKLQLELDEVVGQERLPNVDDFRLLPYLDAVVKEIHRCSSIVPLALPHTTTKTTQINGYTIPKGTSCIANTYAVHYDPRLWQEPKLFRPERFFDENNKVISPPYLIPFSTGSRQCVGRLMAEMEIRLIIAGLFHQFNFSLDHTKPKPSLEPVPRTHEPYQYSLLVELRHKSFETVH